MAGGLHVATIKDVALHAGVSISTVSYVLSGARPISEETKKRILASMDELGYSPNALAQALASKKSRMLALLTNPIDRSLAGTDMEFINGAAHAAHDQGYHLVLWAEPLTTPCDLEDLARQGLVEGVLLMEVTLHDWRIGVLSRLGMPTHMIGRPENPEGTNWVDIDFEKTVSDSLDWLEGAGHTRVVLINQSRQSYDAGYGPVVRVQDSFIVQCEERGMTGTAVFCQMHASAGLDTVRRVIEKYPDTTAILTLNDPALPGIMHGLSEKERRVPQDMSVIALLGTPETAEHFWPALSTMDIPARELGRLGITRLIGRLESKFNTGEAGKTAGNGPTLLPCTLSLRGTTGKAKAGKKDQRKHP